MPRPRCRFWRLPHLPEGTRAHDALTSKRIYNGTDGGAFADDGARTGGAMSWPSPADARGWSAPGVPQEQPTGPQAQPSDDFNDPPTGVGRAATRGLYHRVRTPQRTCSANHADRRGRGDLGPARACTPSRRGAARCPRAGRVAFVIEEPRLVLRSWISTSGRRNARSRSPARATRAPRSAATSSSASTKRPVEIFRGLSPVEDGDCPPPPMDSEGDSPYAAALCGGNSSNAHARRCGVEPIRVSPPLDFESSGLQFRH